MKPQFKILVPSKDFLFHFNVVNILHTKKKKTKRKEKKKKTYVKIKIYVPLASSPTWKVEIMNGKENGLQGGGHSVTAWLVGWGFGTVTREQHPGCVDFSRASTF